MKFMKKYAMLVLAAVFMFSVAAMAQEQNTPPVKKVDTKEIKTPEQKKAANEKRVKKMGKELGLTEAEKTQVLDVFNNENLKPKAKNKELKKILGQERFEKFKTMNGGKKGKKENPTPATVN